jgi:inward rectifier potassium channel
MSKPPRPNNPLQPTPAVSAEWRKSVWSDLRHHAMTASWPSFFTGLALGFVAVNLVFAALYALGDDPIANARPGSLADYFFFSVETIATVGYGDMHPRTLYGHCVATIGTFFGICSLAVVTGLIFARFTQPRAHLLFARNPVVAPHDGARTLMLRFANAHRNMIADASVKLWIVKSEPTAEGASFRRFRQLRLARDENPVFALSWTIMHVIDEDSPLHGWSAEEFALSDAALVVTFNGHDEATGQSVHGRWAYVAADVLFDHAYVDVMRRDDAGVMRVDHARFHDTAPLD